MALRSGTPGDAPAGRGPRRSKRAPFDGPGPRALLVLCCAGPALIAAITIAAIGAITGSPWAFAAAGVLVLAAISLTTRRRRFRDAVAALGRDSPPVDRSPPVRQRARRAGR